MSKNPLRRVFDNKRKKDVDAAAAPEETGGRYEFRHPLKYDLFYLCRTLAHSATKKLFAYGEKDESSVIDFFDRLIDRGHVFDFNAFIQLVVKNAFPQPEAFRSDLEQLVVG
jgi:hypothetical protein